MGKSGKKKRGYGQKSGQSWGTKNKRVSSNNPTGGYDDIIKENAIFEGYYKAQKIVPEEEWESFMAHLREPLPTSFRISGHLSQSKAVLKIIEGEYFKDMTEEQTKPECLSWYPNRVAWQVNLTRKDIRKSEANVKLHNFLVSESETGSITRQEVVSMIPPLVLDVQSHHKVLDMCAAPGSKTTQLIEMLHSEEGKTPEGFVLANDSNNKRCYMLVHQLKRLESPNVVITNHDATIMPNIFTTTKEGGKSVLKFDRILADVPCSGDGTIRKNFDVWTKWNTANSISLHGIQIRVARRGAEMLAVGGKMVYSTCSLNPIENEAVLHRLLSEAKGSLELVDVGDKLPGLKYNQGISTWTIMNRDLTIFNQPEDVPDAIKGLFRPAIFPPKPEDAAAFHFERCIRVLPHQQNTGGFFVAVLKKTARLPWEASVKEAEVAEPVIETADKAVGENAETVKDLETETAMDAEDDKSDIPDEETPEGGDIPEAVVARPGTGRTSPLRKRRKIRGFKEDPYFFFEPTEDIWPRIKDFYGFDESFDHTLLFSRRKDDLKRNIYFTTPEIKDIVNLNFDRLTIINTGVKLMARSDNKGADCGFRIAQEGALIARLYMNKRRVSFTQDDLTLLLLNDDMDEPPEIHRFSADAARTLLELGTGCVLVEHRGEDDLHVVLVAWKGKTSVRAYVPKSDRVHYLRICGADISKFVVNKFEKERQNGAAKQPETQNVIIGEEPKRNDEVRNETVQPNIEETSAEKV